MLEASISVSMMKNILKGLQSITEDCILDFSKDGLTVHVVDSIRAKMLRLKVIPSAFESYTCNEKHRLAVELSKLKAITTSLTTKDELKISYKDNKFALLANNMERAIRLKKIDLVYDLRAIPDFDYEWNTTVSSAKEIKDYIKTLDKIPILQIEVEEQKMVWQTLDAEELISWNPNLEMECEEEFTATQLYTAAEINACIAASTKEEVALCGGPGSCPIQFTWTPYEGVEYTGLVAPRM